MPKPNNLKDIFDRLELDQPLPPKLDHYLFLLGTDTNFVQKPEPEARSYYARGETLSYAAQVMVSLLGEHGQREVNLDQPLSFSSPSVDLLKGPTTLGTDVGQRIAQAVFLVLRAVAHGKTSLQFVAHSRGAVQALLVTHELQRIKHELQGSTERSLFAIFRNSPCSYTRAAIEQYYQDVKEEPAARVKLLSKLSLLTINTFLIDPVPGDSLANLSIMGWDDKRFYERPIVKRYELILARDERSRCFYPIVPKGMRPILLPGHHGTASGNRYSQQLEALPDHIGNSNTTHLQDLVLYKLLYFITQDDAALSNRLADQQIELEHPDLDRLSNEFFQGDKATRLNKMVEFYEKVLINDEAYRYFRQTSYKFLGCTDNDGHRYVHYQAKNDRSMAEIALHMPSSFVNTEHAMMQLRRLITVGDGLDSGLCTILNQITASFKRLFQNDSMIPAVDQELLNKLNYPRTQTIFFDALSVVVDQLGQKYLCDHLSPDEKTELMVAIQSPFKVLKDSKTANQPHINMIETCEKILQAGLITTVNTHAKLLLERSRIINDQIHCFLADSAEVNDRCHHFINRLSDNQHNKISSIQKLLRDIPSLTFDRLHEKLLEEINKISVGPNSAPQDVLDLKEFLMERADELTLFADSKKQNMSSHLQQIEQLYQTMIALCQACPLINNLIAPKSIELYAELTRHSIYLVHLGALLLKESYVNLQTSSSLAVSDEFFSLIKQQALALRSSSLAWQVDNIEQDVQTLCEDIGLIYAHEHNPDIIISHLCSIFEDLLKNPLSMEDSKLFIALKYKTKQDLYFQYLSVQIKSILEDLFDEKRSPSILGRLQPIVQSIENIKKKENVYQLYQPIINRYEYVLQTNLTTIIANHCKQISSVLQELEEQINSSDSDNELQQSVSQSIDLLPDYLKRLIVGENGPDLDNLAPLLTERKQTIASQTDISDDQKNQETTQINNILSVVKSHVDKKQVVLEEHLKKLEIFYLKISSMGQISALLNTLIDSTIIDIQAYQKIYPPYILRLGGLLLKNSRVSLRQFSGPGIGEQFFTMIRNQAIASGVESPELQDLHANYRKMFSDAREQITQLNTAKEVNIASLIETKLLPATRQYRLHLEQQVDNYQVNNKDLLAKGSHPNNNVQEKLVIVCELEKLLTDPEVVLPSNRLVNFSVLLEQRHIALSQLRDPAWAYYMKITLAVLAIIGTGILPGLVGLAIYSSATGRSPLFFTQSKGAEYSNHCHNICINSSVSSH